MRKITFPFAILLLTSCAVSFKPIDPARLNYPSTAQLLGDSLRISYVNNIQYMSHNKRYGDREVKRGMYALAVQIENISSSSVTVTQDNLKIFSGEIQKRYCSSLEYSKNIKQRAGWHLLHILWGPWSLRWQEDSNHGTEVHFVYIPIGAIVGIANAIHAGNANKANRETMEKFQPWGKEIAPNKTLYALITIHGVNGEQLIFSN